MFRKLLLYKFIDENNGRKEEHKQAHELLSYGLKKYFDIIDTPLVYGEHGKPYLIGYPEINFNISHCKGLVICGFSNGNIGVDAELIRNFNTRVMRKLFSDEETIFVNSSEDPDGSFFRIWTLKESLGKYLGTGIFSDLKKHSFYFENGIPFCRNTDGIYFKQSIIQNKWIVSICTDDPCDDIIFSDQ